MPIRKVCSPKITIDQLRKILSKLVGEGKGDLSVEIGETDGTTSPLNYIDFREDEEKLVLT